MSNKNVSGSTCDECGAELVMGDTTPCYCQVGEDEVKKPKLVPKPKKKH